MATKQDISPQMTIADIFTKFPQHSQKIAQAMTNAGLHCGSCSASTWETLEGGMLGHGMTKKDIDHLVVKLNEIIAEKIDVSTITLTERAAKKFLEIAAEDGIENPSLRFGDTAGGCSGFEYVLDFAEEAEADDVVFEAHGVKIFVKKGMVKRLLGSVIDFTDGLHGAGFKISNPNVKSSCGCGKSQGY